MQWAPVRRACPYGESDAPDRKARVPEHIEEIPVDADSGATGPECMMDSEEEGSVRLHSSVDSSQHAASPSADPRAPAPALRLLSPNDPPAIGESSTVECAKEECGLFFASEWEMELHYEAAHRFQCAMCSQSFASAQHLSDHLLLYGLHSRRS
eukprot:ANDGO_05801.mRNA.1 hypothetical protein